MQSLACIFLTSDGVRGTFPSIDSINIAGAVRACPHQLRWRGLARSSCDLAGVNVFFATLMLGKRRKGFPHIPQFPDKISGEIIRSWSYYHA